MGEKRDLRRIAGISMFSKPKDLAGNSAKAKEHIARGAEAGAKLVLLPELCLSGMSPDAYTAAIRADDDILHDLAATAKSLGVAASVGFFERDGRKCYVSQAFLHNGKIACVSRKIFCCERGGSDGEEFHVVDWNGALVGTLICWDLHFPIVSRELAKRGALLILHPSCYSGKERTGTVGGNHNPNSFQTCTRAKDNGCFFFHLNASGKTVKKGFVCAGNSLLAAPTGGVMARIDYSPHVESMMVADIDLEAARNATSRKWMMLEAERTGLIKYLPGRKNPNPV
ncbi:MAG: hypothetical protein A3F84_16510 [Candidatus Handelsmanbacteria bacterium RIFCSPLOWO2_12_FULL_64_10]|uniref:CN hydrolase domain-containing protein n=1 Tax=Handelsmanbacteria sp. (strain RIFCSPLOWO2_12_FULL_64_10) TaxID=1817868 RepID=A0A1F6D318_HANXR|nr:MAG: hypothetical protein A3F84_16510 [Candidatus Handelsmanbacteria bacterium RIFCSPLOWO2_12_FULL_64_10]